VAFFDVKMPKGLEKGLGFARFPGRGHPSDGRERPRHVRVGSIVRVPVTWRLLGKARGVRLAKHTEMIRKDKRKG
jgi:hypothetical protein